MKRNIFKIVIAAVLVSAFAACQKNDEPVPSGSTTLERDKFIGTWHVSSTHTITTPQSWDMDVVTGATSDKILFNRFDVGHANGVEGIVSGNSFNIPQQTVSGQTFKGSGSYSSGTLTFTYTADDGVAVDTVSATAHK
jgi:hypothetical protein